jgi:AcrR family transcriptional regulator
MPKRQGDIALPEPAEDGLPWNSTENAAGEVEGPLTMGGEETAILDSLPDSTRMRRLLRDLETLMLREGFLHLTMGDIAERLRCSKTTLYRLAGSTDDLFELVIRIWLARANDRSWHEYEQASDWPGRLVGFVTTPFLNRDTSYAFIHDLKAFPGGHRALLDYERRRRAVVVDILQQGMEAGVFRTVHPELVADVIHRGADRILEPEFLGSVRLSVSDAFEQLLRLFEYGLIQLPT